MNKNIYLMFTLGISFIFSIASAMENTVLSLEQTCIREVSNNFDDCNTELFQYLTSDLKLTILLERLKNLDEDFYEFGIDPELEDEIDAIIQQVLELLADGILLSTEQAEFIVSRIMHFVTLDNAANLLDLLVNLGNNRQLFSQAIRWGFENKIFEALTVHFDNLEGEIININQQPEHFKMDTPVFTGELERIDKALYYNIYNDQDKIIKRLNVPIFWNIVSHGSKRIIAYDAEKNIIAVPRYVQSLSQDLIVDVGLEIVIEDDCFYSAMSYEKGIHFYEYTKENPVEKILFNDSWDKILFITKNGLCLSLKLPKSVSLLLNGELSLREVFAMLISVHLQKNTHGDLSEEKQALVGKLKNHKILNEISEKNPDLAGNLKLIIEDLIERKLHL